MDRIIISITNDRRAEASGRFFAGDTCEVQIRGLPEGTNAAGLRFAILTPEKDTAAQCFDFDATYTGEVALTTNEIQAMLLNVPAGRTIEAAFRVWTTDGAVLASGFARLVSLPVSNPPRYVTMEVLEDVLSTLRQDLQQDLQQSINADIAESVTTQLLQADMVKAANISGTTLEFDYVYALCSFGGSSANISTINAGDIRANELSLSAITGANSIRSTLAYFGSVSADTICGRYGPLEVGSGGINGLLKYEVASGVMREIYIDPSNYLRVRS